MVLHLPACCRRVKSWIRESLAIGRQAVSDTLIRIVVATAQSFLRCGPIGSAHGLEIRQHQSADVALVQQIEAFECGLTKFGPRDAAIEIGVRGSDGFRKIQQGLTRGALQAAAETELSRLVAAALVSALP